MQHIFLSYLKGTSLVAREVWLFLLMSHNYCIMHVIVFTRNLAFLSSTTYNSVQWCGWWLIDGMDICKRYRTWSWFYNISHYCGRGYFCTICTLFSYSLILLLSIKFCTQVLLDRSWSLKCPNDIFLQACHLSNQCVLFSFPNEVLQIQIHTLVARNNSDLHYCHASPSPNFIDPSNNNCWQQICLL